MVFAPLLFAIPENDITNMERARCSASGELIYHFACALFRVGFRCFELLVSELFVCVCVFVVGKIFLSKFLFKSNTCLRARMFVHVGNNV